MTTLAEPPSTVAAPVTVSVVICCYTMQRWRLLNRAVWSVRRQSMPPQQIIVVVDHCPDLLALARSEIDDVEIVANAHERGLSGARNTGLDVARGDVVAFLDDDAMADGDWLEQLSTTYEQDPSVVGVGGAVTPQWAGGQRPRWFPSEYDWVVGCSYTGQPVEPAPVRNFIGANMSFRRRPVIDIGGFAAHLGRTSSRPSGCEETELCIRLAEKHPGAILQHLPAAAVTHYVSPERCRWSYFVSRCYAEGQSKATVASLTGRSPALRTEREYVRTVLPRGVRTALGGVRRDPAGVPRAAAIVLGLLVTMAGYLVGTIRSVRVARLGSGTGRRSVSAVGALVVAIGLWALALRHVDLDAMDDLGLVSVLPVAYWAALAIVVVGAWTLIRRNRARDRTIAAYIVTLILLLHATPTLLYGSLRYSWAWKHIGIVDFVMRHGTVDPHVSQLAVYHAWPGFFTLGALLTQLGGFHTALSFAAWGPPFFELLDLGPLLLLFRSLTTDRRRIWTAVLVYYLTQWVGQDYFSPQAFAFFLYLVCIAVVLRYLGPASSRRGWRGRRRAAVERRPFLLQIAGLERVAVPSRVRRALAIGLVPVMVVIASSHQLTPIVLVIALAVLVAVRAAGPRWLPWVMAAITIGWIAWLGRTYVLANMQSLIRAFGALESNTGATFVALGRASFEQQLVDWTDRLLTALIWPLALAGFLRQRRLDQRESVPAVLALVPVPMLAANDYGGEMLFRVCLFATPFLAFLVAGLLQPPGPRARAGALPSPRRRRSRRVPARAAAAFSLAIVLALGAMFVVAYDGKERMNYFTTYERTASTWLYDTAPKGALITAINSNYPWAFEHYEYYDYDFLEYLPPRDKARLVTDPLPVMEKFLAAGCTRPAYFIVTRSQEVEVRYTASLDPRSVRSIVLAMRSTPMFRLDYHNRDVDVYQVLAQQCPSGSGGSR
jgi:GT2 family glycosyltransferase